MYYQVQQLHAHAWVEVLSRIEPDSRGRVADKTNSPRRRPGSCSIPPTAYKREARARTGNRSSPALYQYLDYAQVLWTNYVVGLNSKRQQQGIYDPWHRRLQAAVDSLFSREVWQERMRAFADSPLGTFWEWYRHHWFSWRGGLVAVGFSSFVIAVYFSAGGCPRTIARVGLVAAAGRFGNEPPVLEMYRRLESSLARQGLVRHPAQTAYEFAVAAGGDLAENIEHRRVAHLAAADRGGLLSRAVWRPHPGQPGSSKR